MYLDIFDNDCGRYMRIVKSVRKPDPKNPGKTKSSKEIIKNIGPVKRFDDGKPELEKRLKEQFKARTLVIDGFDYDEADAQEKEQVQEMINLSIPKNQWPQAIPQNIGWFYLDTLFEQLGLGDVFRQYKSDSRVEYDILNLAKIFVYQRVIRPQSKRSTMLHIKKYPMYGLPFSFDSKNQWYRSLTVINSLFYQIQKRIDTKIAKSSIGRDDTITYYDVTNIFFEIPYEDEPVYLQDQDGQIVIDELGEPIELDPGFRRKGKSKEERWLPLVQISLAIDTNGLPKGIEIYEGNTHDSTIFGTYLDNLPEKVPNKRSIFVADNGMYSQYNFYKIVNRQDGYIIRKSAKKSWNSVRSWVLENEGWNISYTETNLTENMIEKEASGAKPEANTPSPKPKKRGRPRKADLEDSKNNDTTAESAQTEDGKKVDPCPQTPNVSFKFKSRIVERTAKEAEDSDKKITYKVRQIVYWSLALYKKDKHEGDKLREELELVKQNPSLLKPKNCKLREFLTEDIVDTETGEIIKEHTTVVRILEEKLTELEERFGYLMIETTEVDMHEIVALGKYRGLSRIEAHFRMFKSDLDVRPVFCSTREHIRAHILICYMALVLIRLIQIKIMIAQKQSTALTSRWTFGMSGERVKEVISGSTVVRICEPYYLGSEQSEDQRLINSVFGIDKLDIVTKQDIQDFKSALRKSSL